MSEKKKTIVRYIELLVLRDTPSSADPGAGVKIIVCEWAYDFLFKPGMEKKDFHRGADGKAFSVKLEKRGYYTTKTGELRIGKAEGLTLTDFGLLHPKWKEMITLMKNPPKPPAAPAPAGKKQDDTIEEVPF